MKISGLLTQLLTNISSSLFAYFNSYSCLNTSIVFVYHTHEAAVVTINSLRPCAR